MMYSFDEVISRAGTDCVKHDAKKKFGMSEDVLPLWVADMDFATAPCVVAALEKRSSHPIYGYTIPMDDYYEAIMRWMYTRHHWTIKKDWIVVAPNIVATFNLVCQYFLSPGDSVLVQNPVYHPFKSSALNSGMQIANNPLKRVGNRYEIDFEDFEAQVKNPQVKLFILCNPHNPVGRVWTCGELQRMARLCVDNNVLIISDEIHHDLVYKGLTYTPMGTLDDELTNNLIVCTSTGKTFNLPSIACGNIIIKNPTLRKKFKNTLKSIAFENLSPFTVAATTAAYTEGDTWVDALVDYLYGNKCYIEAFIATHLPLIQVIPCESTYLLWLDCSQLGMTHDELMHFMFHKAKLWVHSGTVFGEEGSGYIRMNIATPRSVLEEAMCRLIKAVKTTVQ